MKYSKISIFLMALLFSVVSCEKNQEKNWNIEVNSANEKVELVDISKEFYNANVPLEQFQQRFPWFQGTVSNEDFSKRRLDKEEAKIYQDAIAKIDTKKLNSDLKELFAHIKHYFPEFKTPKVFLYSSALQSVTDPIFYKPEENFIFIDITAFMGEGNSYYKGLELYYQKSMNPKNIIPKVSLVLAEYFVPYSIEHQKFIDQIVYQGKLMTLQDAFLPKETNSLKINYTEEQYNWCVANESNIWNYFVENDLLFSDDARLVERFIAPSPFSKFYAEIDNESAPQVGIFIGWQICKTFLKENPKMGMKDFLETNAETIFNTSQYSPKVE